MDRPSIIECISPFMGQYNRATYDIDRLIYAHNFQLIEKPATLKDIYHNLEVTRQRLHREIDRNFLEAKAIREMFYIFETTGMLLLAKRKEEDSKYITVIDPV